MTEEETAGMDTGNQPDGITEWRRSSFSGPTNDCVEVRSMHSHLDVRDSKDPEGAMLTFTAQAWRAFVGAVRAGEFLSRS